MIEFIFYTLFLLIGVAAVFSAYMLGLRHGKTEQEELIEKAAVKLEEHLSDILQRR